jgi:hypothetical protein
MRFKGYYERNKFLVPFSRRERSQRIKNLAQALARSPFDQNRRQNREEFTVMDDSFSKGRLSILDGRLSQCSYASNQVAKEL